MTAMTLPDSADQVIISVNPKAGSGRRRRDVQRLVALLDENNLGAAVLSDLDEVVVRAEQLLGEGRLRAVVGAGGDGTIHALLNRVPAEAPLAMLPLGTENLLVKYHGQRRGAQPLVDMLVEGHTAKFDAGRANGRLFLLMASAGFDAEVARRLDECRGASISHLSYITPILGAIRQYEYAPMQIWCDTPDGQREFEARFCFVFNLPKYGVGLPFAPEADATDGLLEICAFRRGSFFSGLRYLFSVAMSQHRELDDCTYVQASRARIETQGDVPYQLDGDPGGWLPLELDVVRKRATLVVRCA
jgi:YegS/Rv2252/BmrU family lipid kinase